MEFFEFLDFAGLTKVKEKILEIINNHTSNNNIHTSTEEKNKLGQAYIHSTSDHAPTDAEKNIIVGVQKNGKDLSIDSTTRKVDIDVPTKLSDLEDYTDFVGEDGCLYSGGIRVDTEIISSTEPTTQVVGDYWVQPM